jgi:hypothetical protein
LIFLARPAGQAGNNEIKNEYDDEERSTLPVIASFHSRHTFILFFRGLSSILVQTKYQNIFRLYILIYFARLSNDIICLRI